MSEWSVGYDLWREGIKQKMESMQVLEPNKVVKKRKNDLPTDTAVLQRQLAEAKATVEYLQRHVKTMDSQIRSLRDDRARLSWELETAMKIETVHATLTKYLRVNKINHKLSKTSRMIDEFITVLEISNSEQPDDVLCD